MLTYVDHEMPHIQALISLREVMSKTFQESKLKPLSKQVAEDMTVTLLPHLMLYTRQHGRPPVRGSVWQDAYVDLLSRAVKDALLLKARFQVSPHRYEMTWHQAGADFDRAKMEELNRREVDVDGSRIGICILPGWERNGKVLHKAMVTLA